MNVLEGLLAAMIIQGSHRVIYMNTERLEWFESTIPDSTPMGPDAPLNSGEPLEMHSGLGKTARWDLDPAGSPNA